MDDKGIEAMDTQDLETLDTTAEIDMLGNDEANVIMTCEPPANLNIDQNMEDDELRSEATFSFKVDNFSKLSDSLFSPAYFVRNLPWKIMVMPRPMINDRSVETKSLGFFLQCNGDSESTTWSCSATAELRLKSFKSGQDDFVRKIKHTFFHKENDWGFSHFMSMNEILDESKGFIQNDAIVLEVHVVAEAPHGVYWDSKKHTGYVGLKNQGATCYMNSLLQTLYFTNQLRKAVYKMPTEADDSAKSVALALQRVFHELQSSDKPVGTKKLTKSFGWETLDSFMQHDVQEFLRVLLDKIENKMKGTSVEGTVPRLFEGKMTSYIQCKNVTYTSSRDETFYDIQLNIKGKKNIYESFKDYIATELLDGDNKYDAGSYGLQEAEKGVKFVAFPPVLHLHLMRFQYDPITDNSVKFNDRFEFYDKINLDQYLDVKQSTPAKYTLHAVLVHSGDNHGGHYVVFINPNGDGKWCKFDDDVVSRCTKEEAIEQNYGGDEYELNIKHSSNAYMLVYIRDSELPNVLQQVAEEDIPSELQEKLQEEKRLEIHRRRERNDSSAYITVNVLLEDYLEIHGTTDLLDYERANYRSFRVKKQTTIAELTQMFVETFNMPLEKMRIWPITQRNSFFSKRPRAFDLNEERARMVQDCSENSNPWIIFLELLPPDSEQDMLPSFDRELQILLFFKYYDSKEKHLIYSGYGYFQLTAKISTIIPELLKRAGLEHGTELTLYEESGPHKVEKIHDFNDTLQKIFNKRNDSAIIIFEKAYTCNNNINNINNKETIDANFELPTVDLYFKDILSCFEVTFIDKTNPNEPGFVLEFSHRTMYEQMARAVGQRINVDPYEIQFFKYQGYKEIPVRCTYEGTIKDLVCNNKVKGVRKLFYQILSMPITELENKKQFKCLWLAPNLKEEKELILYPNKNGTVKTLLEEAAKVVEFAEDGTHCLRINDVSGHKLVPGPSDDTPLDSLQCPELSATQTTNTTNLPQQPQPQQKTEKTYRIEEIPQDEMIIRDDEMLISVVHFYKDTLSTFGIPFLIKIKADELWGVVKERIQKKLNLSDKEWEKYKFAKIISERVEYIQDDTEKVILNQFKCKPNQPRPYLGLEHVNKLQKRSRFSYLEKAIKIYN